MNTIDQHIRFMGDMIWKINGRELTDRQLIEAILKRDNAITKGFFLGKCYRFFASIYNKYYTDCKDVKEFINEIYFYLLYPGQKSKRSKLETFEFKCSFIGWLEYVTENYCKALFKKRQPMLEKKDDHYDISAATEISIEAVMSTLDREDVMTLIGMMENEDYRTIIRMRYIEHKEHKEIAKVIGVEGPYYYTMHDRAKDQFREVLKREGLL